ncbi:MAG: PAAR domain-containing protein [Deltaproteobacteria bacterium]|nr:PAAR domain-containing protein [Deltaproteobacteria bacterium]
MPGNARLGDIWCGVCVCHKFPIPMCGPIITASVNVGVNALGAARIFDMTMGYCGHCGVIVTGSPDTFINGRGAARLSDSVSGCNVGNIVSASPNVLTNG